MATKTLKFAALSIKPDADRDTVVRWLKELTQNEALLQRQEVTKLECTVTLEVD